jgi:O-acetylhomoserine/O-acetylserine sulfhydrylase-like pyridoxal-dependent enzyme
MSNLKFETLQLHAGQEADPTTGFTKPHPMSLKTANMQLIYLG